MLSSLSGGLVFNGFLLAGVFTWDNLLGRRFVFFDSAMGTSSCLSQISYKDLRPWPKLGCRTIYMILQINFVYYYEQYLEKHGTCCYKSQDNDTSPNTNVLKYKVITQMVIDVGKSRLPSSDLRRNGNLGHSHYMLWFYAWALWSGLKLA